MPFRELVPMLPWIVLVDVVGLVWGGYALWGPRGREGGPWHDLWQGLKITVALMLGAFLLVLVLQLSMFAVLRLWCHVFFCVAAPLLIARGAWRLRRSRAGGAGLAFLLLGLAMEGTYVYARHVEPRALEVNHHVIESPRLGGLDAPVRVVVLADLQTDEIGAYEAEVFRRIDALAPDLLLLAGDYIQCFRSQDTAAQGEALRALLRTTRHRPRLGSFAIMGDTEQDADLFRGTHIQMLQDQVVALPGVPIQVLGLGYERTFDAMGPKTRQPILDFEGFTIVLGHRPDFMRGALAGRFDHEFLGVAGHTHGGQVVVPGFGPPLTLSDVPRRYASGFHRVGKVWHLVSRGVGLERLTAPRIRLFCPPELVVVELRAP